MTDVSNLSKTEFVKFNIELVKNLLTKQGYKILKIAQGKAKVDFTVFRNKESFNIKITGYRYNEKVSGNYAYIRKTALDLDKFQYLYFVLYLSNHPHILKIPTTKFKNIETGSPFKNRNYTGLKSLPEYGIEMNKKTISELLMYEER